MAEPREDPGGILLSIERALPGDYDAIVELYREAQWRAPDRAGEFWLARHADTPIAVAQVVDAPAGYAFLEAMVVTQNQRRRRVGTRLLARVLPLRHAEWWLECRLELIPLYSEHAFVTARDEDVPEWVRHRVGMRPRPLTFMWRP